MFAENHGGPLFSAPVATMTFFAPPDQIPDPT
jgi:hypothetical protein